MTTSGPIYIVMLMGNTAPLPSTTALVLYRGDNEAAAQAAYADGIRMESERTSFLATVPRGTVYLTVVREEEKLS